jgi:hypothetical protein
VVRNKDIPRAFVRSGAGKPILGWSVLGGPVAAVKPPGGDRRDDGEEDDGRPGHQVGYATGEAVGADRDAVGDEGETGPVVVAMPGAG